MTQYNYHSSEAERKQRRQLEAEGKKQRLQLEAEENQQRLQLESEENQQRRQLESEENQQRLQLQSEEEQKRMQLLSDKETLPEYQERLKARVFYLCISILACIAVVAIGVLLHFGQADAVLALTSFAAGAISVFIAKR